jgi:hypothetical protein
MMKALLTKDFKKLSVPLSMKEIVSIFYLAILILSITIRL